ncbi:MAG: Fic family protein, partial [Candidatus Omnitrophota bacterium]
SWPQFTWDSTVLLPVLGQARLCQGDLLGRVKRLGFKLEEEAQANILIEEVIKTSEIEGELLNLQMVRSSVARHLGLPTAGLGRSSRSVDGIVEVVLDATQKFDSPLNKQRLFGWHGALFPTGYSGLHKIRVAQWRGEDPMRVVSGPVGRERIHFEAPPGEAVDGEMRKFLEWWKGSRGIVDGLLRAGVAHFYFLTIHPFEDGNGRIARSLTDMALAQDEKLKVRYYSFSSEIMEERDDYYKILEKNSKGSSLDLTDWLLWFLGCYQRAIQKSEKIMGKVLLKADFWAEHAQVQLNERQKKVLNCMLDKGPGEFVGGLTTRKYVSLGSTSRATAFREISDMVEKGLLRQASGGGRSVHYEILWPKSLI